MRKSNSYDYIKELNGLTPEVRSRALKIIFQMKFTRNTDLALLCKSAIREAQKLILKSKRSKFRNNDNIDELNEFAKLLRS